MASSSSSSAMIRKVYRDFYHHLSRLPDHRHPHQSSGLSSSKMNKTTTKSKESMLHELRTTFRKPLESNETMDARLEAAHAKLAFIRMTTAIVKPRMSSSSSMSSLSSESTTTNMDGKAHTRKWIYKDGKRYEHADDGTLLRDPTTGKRVVSTFDGKNLDPQAVTKHRKLLRRAGFVNNQHAKGYF